MMKPDKSSPTKAAGTSGNGAPVKPFQKSRRSSSFNGIIRFSTSVGRCNSTTSFTTSTESNGAAAITVDKKRSSSYKRRRNSESDKKGKSTKWKLPMLHRKTPSLMPVRVKVNDEREHCDYSCSTSGDSLEASLSMSGDYTLRVSYHLRFHNPVSP